MVVFYYYGALNTESILIQTITINTINFLRGFTTTKIVLDLFYQNVVYIRQ